MSGTRRACLTRSPVATDTSPRVRSWQGSSGSDVIARRATGEGGAPGSGSPPPGVHPATAIRNAHPCEKLTNRVTMDLQLVGDRHQIPRLVQRSCVRDVRLPHQVDAQRVTELSMEVELHVANPLLIRRLRGVEKLIDGLPRFERN